jgi:hypothetical protein
VDQAAKVAVVGSDLTCLKCKGEKLAVAITVDEKTGVTLDIEIVEDKVAETLSAWLEPLLELVGADILLTDDQDGFKTVANQASLKHQICRQRVTRNVLDFVAQTAERVWTHAPTVPPELECTTDQLREDLALLEWIMLGQPKGAQQYLAALYDRYAKAPSPKKGQRATVWYRMRNHVFRLRNHWQRHVCYQSVTAEQKLELSETNGMTERVIGRVIKERYRAMRGYKRSESIQNVAHLTTWLQKAPEKKDMTPLFTW